MINNYVKVVARSPTLPLTATVHPEGDVATQRFEFSELGVMTHRVQLQWLYPFDASDSWSKSRAFALAAMARETAGYRGCSDVQTILWRPCPGFECEGTVQA